MSGPITYDEFKSDMAKMFGDAVEGAYKDLIEKAVAEEREACAAILDANAMACQRPIMRSLLQSNAQAIRTRGQA
mgnify:CR=1 FL=1